MASSMGIFFPNKWHNLALMVSIALEISKTVSLMTIPCVLDIHHATLLTPIPFQLPYPILIRCRPILIFGHIEPSLPPPPTFLSNPSSKPAPKPISQAHHAKRAQPKRETPFHCSIAMPNPILLLLPYRTMVPPNPPLVMTIAHHTDVSDPSTVNIIPHPPPPPPPPPANTSNNVIN